ncbi:hypothetical protein THRCLA_20766, partial [Thraustotheca clavata]
GKIPSLFCCMGQKETVLLLISENADVNQANRNGETALHICAERNCKEIALLLLSKEANINQSDTYGNTPLHFAAKYGHKDISFIANLKGSEYRSS